MLMLSKARRITRDALASIGTPEATDTWRPLPHAEVVNTLIDRATARGLKVKEESYAVMNGKVYMPGQPQNATEVPNARLFGSLDFEPNDGLPFPTGCTPSAGLRNSHDKTFALSILSGARVFVCANGVLNAEHIISRKHTSGIDLVESIDAALDAFMVSIGDFRNTYQKLTAHALTREEAAFMVVAASRAGAFCSGHILQVMAEYEKPTHKDFEPRNLWSLYNAATEVMKAQSPARQVQGFKALTAVLVDGKYEVVNDDVEAMAV